MFQVATAYKPPLFTCSGDIFDNDFDIGLLSEYLFDEEPAKTIPVLGSKNGYLQMENDNNDNFNLQLDDGIALF